MVVGYDHTEVVTFTTTTVAVKDFNMLLFISNGVKTWYAYQFQISEIGVDVSLVVGYDHTEVYKHNYKFCNSQVGQMTELLTQTEQNQSFSPTSSWIPAHLLIKDNR